MHKLVKKQLIAIIGTIYDALNACKKNAEISLLADCQNAVVVIGEKIEESEGEGTAAVTYLEEFADLIYEASLLIDNETELRKTINKSRDKLKQAEHELKKNIKVKQEILFIPYKASMWDALDSIYRKQ